MESLSQIQNKYMKWISKSIELEDEAVFCRLFTEMLWLCGESFKNNIEQTVYVAGSRGMLFVSVRMEYGKKMTLSMLNWLAATEMEEVLGFPILLIEESISLREALSQLKICESKGDAKRFISGGRVYVDENKVVDVNFIIKPKVEWDHINLQLRGKHGKDRVGIVTIDSELVKKSSKIVFS